MKHLVASLASLVVTAGCALPLPTGPAHTRPAEDAVDAAAVTPRSGAGAIVVTREKQLKHIDCVYDVGLDGKPVAELRRAEQVTLYADPGERKVSISIRPENDCDPAAAEFPLHVVANATTRISVRSEARYELKIVATTN